MAVVRTTDADIDLLARLLRAEAEGEGELGMLLVGNVGINRMRADCSDFTGLRTVSDMVYQAHALKQQRKVIFIKDQEKVNDGWREG